MDEKKKLLEDIEAAITKITITGQSYKIGSRSLTRADLGALMDARKTLQAELAEDTSNNGIAGFYAAEFEGR